MSAALEQLLAPQDLSGERRTYHLLIDAPRGWAFQEHPLSLRRTIIVSDNPCPEYQLDLLARGPAALISQPTLSVLLKALSALQAGKRLVPKVHSRLTPTERLTLQLIARGCSVKAVAEMRGAKTSTTRNTIQILYTKLELKSAVQLSHYYYGNWELLPDSAAAELSGGSYRP